MEPKKQEIALRIEPQSLLAAAIEKGASVETLERLLALAKDVRAEQAREQFNRAFATFQNSCPAITKTKEAQITTRTGGSYKYTYTPLEDIVHVIVPIMTPLGLSVSYRMGGTKDSVSAVAVVTHELGHFKESGEVVMPVVLGGSGANPAQCVGIAATYARRYALLAVTGISPCGEGTDAAPPNGHAAVDARPTQAPPPKESFPTQVGEIVGTVGKLTARISKKGEEYLVFTLNEKSIFVWDKTLFSFIRENENNSIAVIAETKGQYTNLISARPVKEAGPPNDDLWDAPPSDEVTI